MSTDCPPERLELFYFIIMKQEIWKDLKDFEGFYEASSTGFIRRKLAPTYYKDGRIAFFSQTVLKPTIDHKGYLRVHLSVASKKYSKRVHRLIAKTFIENPNILPQINHKDCDKKNNNVKNLEWCTNLQNMRHAFENGMFKERDKTTVKNLGKYAQIR